jgi:hypothetical protein
MHTEETVTEEVRQRSMISEEMEEENIDRAAMGYKFRYPVERMVFGIEASQRQRPVEGDDIYTTSSMERFYGDERTQARQSGSFFRRKAAKAFNQYDVHVNDNNYVVATSMPLVMVADAHAEASIKKEQIKKDAQDDTCDEQVGPTLDYGRRGSPSWYENLNSRLSTISQEAFTFMQSGLSVVSDFQSLYLPADMRRVNVTKMFSRYRHELTMTGDETFSDRDQARQLLEEYLSESDASMMQPPILLEEQARLLPINLLQHQPHRIQRCWQSRSSTHQTILDLARNWFLSPC